MRGPIWGVETQITPCGVTLCCRASGRPAQWRHWSVSKAPEATSATRPDHLTRGEDGHKSWQQSPRKAPVPRPPASRGRSENPGFPLPGCWALSQSLYLSRPQFPRLKVGVTIPSQSTSQIIRRPRRQNGRTCVHRNVFGSVPRAPGLSPPRGCVSSLRLRQTTETQPVAALEVGSPESRCGKATLPDTWREEPSSAFRLLVAAGALRAGRVRALSRLRLSCPVAASPLHVLCPDLSQGHQSLGWAHPHPGSPHLNLNASAKPGFCFFPP